MEMRDEQDSRAAADRRNLGMAPRRLGQGRRPGLSQSWFEFWKPRFAGASFFCRAARPGLSAFLSKPNDGRLAPYAMHRQCRNGTDGAPAVQYWAIFLMLQFTRSYKINTLVIWHGHCCSLVSLQCHGPGNGGDPITGLRDQRPRSPDRFDPKLSGDATAPASPLFFIGLGVVPRAGYCPRHANSSQRQRRAP